MNFVKRASQAFGAGLSLSDFDRVLDQMYGGSESYTGKAVSPSSALGVSTVWSCIQVLSGDIATLPFLPYRYIKEGREPARDHYLWRLLQQEVNSELTAFRFKQLMQAWLLLHGNAYAEIEISGRGQVTALWPWRPDRVEVSRAGGPTGPLQYVYKLKTGQRIGPVPADRMLHLRGLGTDGVLGLSPIEVHKQAIGYALAIQEHGARFFANGARPLGTLSTPGSLTPKALQSLKDSWIGRHEGLTNAHRLAILEEGLVYAEAGSSMVDAAYIEAAGMTDEQVARAFNMPQHKVGILTHATFSNIEHMSLDYVLGTLAPWCTNWYEEIQRSLLSTRESQQICVRPNYRSRLRGDHAAMALFISQLVDRGILSADEVREEFLDMNPQPGKIGREYYKALNMAPVTEDNFGKGPATTVGKIIPKKTKDEDDQSPSAEVEFLLGLAQSRAGSDLSGKIGQIIAGIASNQIALRE